MLELFFITVICVIIIDLSGVIESIKSGIKKLLTRGRMSDPNYSLKPLDCSFCINFWVCIIYLIVTGTLSLWMVTYVLLLSVMTPVIRDFIILVRDTLVTFIAFTYNKINQ